MTVVDRDTISRAIDKLLERLQTKAAEQGARALLLVEMPSDGALRAADPVIDRADRLALRLGTENRRLLHDARGTFDPALLAAEIGTLMAGGLLVLLIDPADATATRSIARLVRHLDRLLGTMPDTGRRLALPASKRILLQELCDVSGEARTDSLHVPADVLIAQDDRLGRIVRHLGRSGARSATLITAPRGRGKSALAGRLAAHWERCGVAYLVTAAHRAATDVLERHRRLALATAPATVPAALPFVAPDVALRRRGEALIVDEAASMPLPSIAALLGRHDHTVLASTSEGHESAGRAFALQIRALLQRERPDTWLDVAPTEPLRWREGDPLEAFVSRTLLPHAEITRTGIREDLSPASLQMLCAKAREVDRDTLIDDEARLSALFGLLSATHYQSSPLDLVHLLDNPALRLWAVERDDTVLGVALVAIERGLPPALHEDVLARRRRPPHCLLPQLLAQCADDALALDADFARVVRIAVHPDARRCGIGSRLVAALARDTVDEVEAVGASFGARDAALAFWHANGFRRFHLGHRRNARSGVRSAAVLKAASERTSRVLADAVTLHHDNLTATPPSDGDPDEGRLAGNDSARGSLAGDDLFDRGPVGVDERRDLRLLRRFAAAERSVADTRGALVRLVDREARLGATSTGRDDGGASARDTSGRGVSWSDEAVAEDTTRLLIAFGEPVPASRRARESALRDAVRARLATPT